MDEVVRSWPVVGPVRTERLRLDPLRVGDAETLLPVLSDEALYRWTGGAPPTLEQLRERLMNQVYGRSPDGEEGWFNWVLRLRDGGEVVGTVQATAVDLGFREVEVAWIVGAAHQGRGYAVEAAHGLSEWLVELGARELCAYVHPGNLASQGVARRLGMEATGDRRYDEVRWQVRAGHGDRSPSQAPPRVGA